MRAHRVSKDICSTPSLHRLLLDSVNDPQSLQIELVLVKSIPNVTGYHCVRERIVLKEVLLPYFLPNLLIL